MRVAIAGYGDLGQRLGRRLRDAGHAVLGLRRSAAAAEPGIELRALDVARLAAGELASWQAEALVVALSPDERSPEGYRRTYIDPLPGMAAAFGSTLRRSLLVSSTAVYGEQDDGAWVDEDTPTRPTRWNGRLLVEAEARAADCLPGLSVARASGLYGPGRGHLLRRALAGEIGQARWTNRIQIDDAAAALAHLLAQVAPADCYCLSDDRPALEHEVLAGLRALRGGGTPAVPCEPGQGSGRRVSNRRLRDSGWRPDYPGWQEGYAALLRAADDA